MTKAEERKVLSEICKLIDSTGQDGYVKMAFAGVPYYAERNIEEDGAFNPVEERDMWENKAHELERQSKEVGGKLLKIEHERDALESNLTALRGEYEVKHQKWCEANKRIAEMQEQIDVCGETMEQNEKDIASLEAEIIRLKAKLYDYMEGAK